MHEIVKDWRQNATLATVLTMIAGLWATIILQWLQPGAQWPILLGAVPFSILFFFAMTDPNRVSAEQAMKSGILLVFSPMFVDQIFICWRGGDMAGVIAFGLVTVTLIPCCITKLVRYFLSNKSVV